MTRSTSPPETYEDNFFTWTQEQAAALRRSADRLPNDVDVEHCAEEIEDLGRRDLREVNSHLRLLFFHLMKIVTSPEAPSLLHWRSEAREFGRAAMRAFSPGMRQWIDVATLWREAAQRLDDDRRDAGLTRSNAVPCPFELDDLLSEGFDLDGAIAKLRAAHAR